MFILVRLLHFLVLGTIICLADSYYIPGTYTLTLAICHLLAFTVWHDLYYFLLHWSLHFLPFRTLRRIHATHHSVKDLRFRHGLLFGDTEGLLQVLGFSFLIYLGTPWWMSILCVLTASIYSCIGHSPLVRFRSPSILNSESVHSLHHRKGTVNLGLYTNLWDRLFGTYQRPAG